MNFGVETDDTDPEFAKIVGSSINSFQKRFAAIIVFGQQRGELSVEVDAEQYALKVFCLLEGAILCSKVFNSPTQLQVIIGVIKKDFKRFLN